MTSKEIKEKITDLDAKMRQLENEIAHLLSEWLKSVGGSYTFSTSDVSDRPILTGYFKGQGHPEDLYINSMRINERNAIELSVEQVDGWCECEIEAGDIMLGQLSYILDYVEIE